MCGFVGLFFVAAGMRPMRVRAVLGRMLVGYLIVAETFLDKRSYNKPHLHLISACNCLGYASIAPHESHTEITIAFIRLFVFPYSKCNSGILN